MDDRRYRIRDKEVAAKAFDDEVVIINLASSFYYSLSGAGRPIWELIAAGWSIAEMAARMTGIFGVDGDVASRDIAALVDRLVADGLIEEAPDRQPDLAVAVSAPKSGAGYAAPELDRYTDMEDMLALDPPLPDVPAVDEAGGGE